MIFYKIFILGICIFTSGCSIFVKKSEAISSNSQKLILNFLENLNYTSLRSTDSENYIKVSRIGQTVRIQNCNSGISASCDQRAVETVEVSIDDFVSVLKAAYYIPGRVTDRVKSLIKKYNKLKPDDEYAIKIGIRRIQNLTSSLSIPSTNFEHIDNAEDFNSYVDILIDALVKKTNLNLNLKCDSNSVDFYVLLKSFLFQKIDFLEFVNVDAGAFVMGSPLSEQGRNEDEAQHRVELTNSFQVQKTAMTQAQYFLIMGYNPSSFSRILHCPSSYLKVNGVELCPFHPVENVSWFDIQIFLRRLSLIRSKFVYDLPTEAEREYFTRAGNTDKYFFGDNESELINYGFWLRNSKSQTQEVGLKTPNLWDIFDTHGNVWEFVSDYYNQDYVNGKVVSVLINPKGPPTGLNRSMRGGSWGSPGASALRSARRNFAPPDYRGYMIGFRLKRTLRDK